MDINEAKATLDRAARERQALEQSYGDLKTELDDLIASGGPSADIDERYRELLAFVQRFGNYIQTEREQNAMLWKLLTDAYARLAEAYDLQ